MSDDYDVAIVDLYVLANGYKEVQLLSDECPITIKLYADAFCRLAKKLESMDAQWGSGNE